jgi:superfamily I DNA/RNA helicase
MPLKTYLAEEYKHRHEHDMFRALNDKLEQAFATSEEEYKLLGNISVESAELDALLIGPRSITVVEMKDYQGTITFSENGSWTTGDRVIRGGNQINPFRQVRASKFSLLNWLERHFSIIKKGEKALGHIAGVVVFSDSVSLDGEIPEKISSWFKVTDINSSSSVFKGITSSLLEIKGDTQKQILKKLGLNDSHRFVHQEYEQSLVTDDRSTNRMRLPVKIGILRESIFIRNLIEAKECGGEIGIAANHLSEGFRSLPFGENPLEQMQREEVSDLEGFYLFKVAPKLILGTFIFGESLYPMVLGDEGVIEDWHAANTGVTLIMNADGRIVLSAVNSSTEIASSRFELEQTNFLKRLDGFSTRDFVAKNAAVRLLDELGPLSSQADIDDALELVDNQSSKELLNDLIKLLADNNIPGAKIRLGMLSGEACPAVDLPDQLDKLIESGNNTDVVASLDDLSVRDKERFLSGKGLLDWIVYPHPEQRRIAYADYDKPVILTGVSGSGKTCVLIHRARYLANKYKKTGERIGIITLNRALADFLKVLIEEICSPEERESIVTISFYDYFSSLLKEVGFKKYFSDLKTLREDGTSLHRVIDNVNQDRMVLDGFSPSKNEEAEEAWYDMQHNRHPDFQSWITDLRLFLEGQRVDAEKYMHEEITLIRSALTISERKSFYEDREDTGAERFRTGRGVQFTKEQRHDMLHILSLYSEFLLAGEILDTLELTQALIPSWEEISKLPIEKRFRCLLVDEFQDLSTLDLRLLTHVVKDQENGLFLAGDKVQKILVKKTELSKCALGHGNVIEKSITKNYRNSKQILTAASVLANHYGSLAKGMGEDIEILNPEYAERETNRPIAVKCTDQISSAWAYAQEVLTAATQSWNVCIVTVDTERLSPESILSKAPKGLNSGMIAGDKINTPGAIVVSSLEDIKGFEFKTVIIVGLDQMWFPPSERHKDEVWRDALRLYVAMTRARDHVYLLYKGSPSPFLEKMREEIQWREEALQNTAHDVLNINQDGTECPHCRANVLRINLDNHINSKCSALKTSKVQAARTGIVKYRPIIQRKRVPLKLFRQDNISSIRCSCGSIAVPGTNRCYSCG